MSITLQETFDGFLLEQQNQEDATPDDIEKSEQTFLMLTEYLIYYSDLFQSEEIEDDFTPEKWEESLDTFVEQLLQGEHQHEHPPSLEELPLDRITGEYLRDFLGWHLLREPGINSIIVQDCAETLLKWLDYTHKHKMISDKEHESASDIVKDTLPDAKRAVIAAHLLLYHIRLGMGISPRLRGQRFDDFKEGHARIAEIKKQKIWLNFDSDPEDLIGPIKLPDAIIQQLRVGDVIDIELGKRSNTWSIVDIGPVYPAVVYVDAQEMLLPEKHT